MTHLISLITAIVLAAPGLAQNFAGVYTVKTEDGAATLKLSAPKGGIVSGSVTMGDTAASFSGRVSGGRIVGTLTVPDSDAKASFTIVPQGNAMVFEYMLLGQDGRPVPGAARTMVFTGTAKPTTTHPTVKPHQTSARQSAGAVRINGVGIAPAELDRLARKYGQRIPPGSYWYDRRSGAWGKTGGATLGFTAAGLDLGGKLQSDASNGNTGVYINGRQLHVLDVRSLQAAGIPVAQGRWWVDSQFNFGAEGSSAPMGNLIQIAKQASGKKYGGSYSGKTGVSTASDGEGGFMATVKDGHGGYIGWYSGQ